MAGTMPKIAFCLAVASIVCVGLFSEGRAFIIDFEDLPDSTPVTDQYSALGITFSGGVAAESGITLFELECPPHSGSKALLIDAGPLTISFSSPVHEFGTYISYAAPLSLTFYDQQGDQIGTWSSLFSSNFGLSGDSGSSPNELFTFRTTVGLSSVVFHISPDGNSYVLDDVSASSVPEASPLLFVVAGILSIYILTQSKRLRLLFGTALHNKRRT
jgi:hypothetical protein